MGILTDQTGSAYLESSVAGATNFPFTLSAWGRAVSGNAIPVSLYKPISGQNSYCYLRHGSTQGWIAYAISQSNGEAARYSNDERTGWTHVAATWTAIGTAPSLWLNGVAASGTTSTGSGTIEFTKTGIGTWIFQNTRGVRSGWAANVCVFNEALSESQVKALARNLDPRKVAGKSLRAWYLPERAKWQHNLRNFADVEGELSAVNSPAVTDDPPQMKTRRQRRVGSAAAATKYWLFGGRAARIIGGGLGG